MNNGKMRFMAAACGLLILAAPFPSPAQGAAGPVGIFEGHGDVGTVLHPGSAEYDAAAKTYTIAGSGENMWAAADAFQFVWKKASGDLSLTADISFIGTGGNAHRKAVLIVRQSLDADSPYADVALHGVGLTSVQSRDEKGAVTHEVQAAISGPKRLRLIKRGAYVYMSLAPDGGEPQFAGGAMRVPLQDPFYVGFGVCAHDPNVVEKAVFSNVELTPLPPAAARPTLWSTLETVTVASTDRRVTWTAPERIEAPNWTKDGKTLVFTRNGRLNSVPETGGNPEAIDTVSAVHCNSSHAISPDGAWIAFSDESRGGRSMLYIVPVAGGAPRRVLQEGPSYVHGWSPDGKTLVFSARRSGKTTDVYTIPAEGGRENRLTYGAGGTGVNDAPEYSPDGQYIYFHSARSGAMQIWRMKPDGKDQEQVTNDGFYNAFPHVAPNGRQIVFLSYPKDVKGFPQDKEVMLRVMNLGNKSVTILTKLIGGLGTIDAPSWSPDSRRLAFVSYHLMPAAAARKK